MCVPVCVCARALLSRFANLDYFVILRSIKVICFLNAINLSKSRAMGRPRDGACLCGRRVA